MATSALSSVRRLAPHGLAIVLLVHGAGAQSAPQPPHIVQRPDYLQPPPPPPDPPPPPRADPFGTQFVSGEVYAAWSTRSTTAPYPELRLLVLWRGSPEDWALKGGGKGVQRHGATDPASGRPIGVFGAVITVGAIAFGLDIDPDANTATVAGETVSLDEANVLLVEIDQNGQSRIVRRLQVDPVLPAVDQFNAVIKREPALRAFLRCDRHYSVPNQEQMARILCSTTLN